MKISVLLVGILASACATPSGVFEQRDAARDTRDAGYMTSLVGGAVVVAAAGAVLVVPAKDGGTAILVAAPVAAVGAAAFGLGGVMAKNASAGE